jgi:hypothetical protein
MKISSRESRPLERPLEVGRFHQEPILYCV